MMHLARTVFACSCVGLATMSGCEQPPASPSALDPNPEVADLHILPFSLINQHDEPVSEDIFEGKVTALSFIFTNCVTVCPVLMGANHFVIDAIERDLPDAPIQFVSITVDPNRDTPERLLAYGTAQKIDFDRWSLLSGDQDAIWTMIGDGLKFMVGTDEDEDNTIALQDGTSMANINHPGHIILVGPEGKVLGIYGSSSDEAMDLLIARMHACAKEMGTSNASN